MAATLASAFAAGMFLAGAALAEDTKTDADTGPVIDEGFLLVKGRCTGCHSAKLITHSGKTREGWIDSIRWMQRNQGLGDLGSTEEPIVSYMVTTPPKGPELLPGITRDLIVELLQAAHLPCHETRISAEALASADEIWLTTSSTREICPVTTLDGRPVGRGVPGPLWRGALDLYQAYKQRTYLGEAEECVPGSLP